MSINASALPDVTLEIVDGIKVVVPDSLELITPYVLREQLDWFEDEIKFIRTLLQPGDVVLDIGANYGLYTLSMAKVVGKGGHVYAFEPASKTASYLTRSIAQNNFDQISLIRTALSNRSGVAEFGLNDNSELNSLDISVASNGKTESVNLTTLDSFSGELSGRTIKFIKLDAEGEEGRILSGGDFFLKNYSPLIMFELKHGSHINIALIEQFRSIGYALYRLIPGLNLLAPFSLSDPLDGYQLNLFACKDDCSTQLADAGKLVFSKKTTFAHIEASKNWEQFIFKFPYAQNLKSKWKIAQQNLLDNESKKYLEILSLYFSINTVSSEARYHKLKQICLDLQALCVTAPTLPRLISLSRIESELGQRVSSIGSLNKAVSLVMQGKNMLDEPFLAASIRFETLDPQNKILNWLLASLLEQLEKLCYFSSYYSGSRTLQTLNFIRSTSFQSIEMDRRIQLIKQRFAITA